MITEGRLKGIVDQSGKTGSHPSLCLSLSLSLSVSLSHSLPLCLCVSLSLSPFDCSFAEGVLYFIDTEDEISQWNDSIRSTCHQLHEAVVAIEELVATE
jgi:hypothetical protein